jgi:elongation factor 1-alpha
MKWYKGWIREVGREGKVTGETLLQAIDSTEIPTLPYDKPLRLPLLDVYNVDGIGTVHVDRVESGNIKA